MAVGGRLLRLARPRDGDGLLDERSFASDEYLPYWAQLWPSALALARAVAADPPAGRAVVELGCGLGLPAIVAALAPDPPPARVLATDWSADAVAFAAANAARNHARLSTAVCGWAEPDLLVAAAPWDLVLAADVLYERRNGDLLGDLLPLLVDPGGEVWVADPDRPHTAGFLEAAAGWSERRSTRDRRVPGVAVHRLRRRAQPARPSTRAR